MKFSIAVPSYQHGRYLRECLRSVEVQTHRDFEVLIADGGSTDGSLAVIDDFTSHDSRFQLVGREDDGHADAIAKAFGYATGNVLCFLNADDYYLHADVLERVATEFESQPGAAIVTGSGVYVDDEGSTLRPVRLRYHPLDGIQWMQWRTALLQPATFWRSEVAANVPLRLDAKYSFDTWFFYDAWKRDYRIREIAVPLAAYRLHGANKSLQICAERIAELARFEDHKFGDGSFRGRYLRGVQRIVDAIESLPVGRALLKRVVYLSVNSVSFTSAYRLPSI